ncbi:MAG TPA: choice-of-anchor U domain-containing protein, partial [Usitatibacter sp.]|nr:choice-of-anchor U domain-containing protein [Usitatibacter sp.]
QSVTFNVDFPQALPPTAQWWKYGATPEDRSFHWYVMPATVNGNRITFTITDGGFGDDDLARNGTIADFGMLSVPGGLFQDLWWSGPAENGWGISMVQHRDVLFANVFAYDAQGVPTWYVMPSGSWDSSHTVYTGALYLPKGSPFYAYDASRFDIGAPVGTATITFNGTNQATFDYTINGVTGRKNISRVSFGPVEAPPDKPLGDLWWAGSAQNGWGIAVLQQYSTLFALWFTYDANGKATWFVMPGGSWTAKDDYRGNIYRAVGPPWLGVPYDVSRHRTIEAGTFRIHFSGETATFEYTLDGKTGSLPLSRIPF